MVRPGKNQWQLTDDKRVEGVEIIEEQGSVSSIVLLMNKHKIKYNKIKHNMLLPL